MTKVADGAQLKRECIDPTIAAFTKRTVEAKRWQGSFSNGELSSHGAFTDELRAHPFRMGKEIVDGAVKGWCVRLTPDAFDHATRQNERLIQHVQSLKAAVNERAATFASDPNAAERRAYDAFMLTLRDRNEFYRDLVRFGRELATEIVGDLSWDDPIVIFFDELDIQKIGLPRSRVPSDAGFFAEKALQALPALEQSSTDIARFL